MFDVGTVCVKIAGRDAGKTCVIVEVLDSNFVMVEGQARRRKVNMKHIEPVGKTVKIKKGDSHETVMKALGLEPVKKASKKTSEKPKRTRKKAETESPRKAKKKSSTKKAEKKSSKKSSKKKTVKKEDKKEDAKEATEEATSN